MAAVIFEELNALIRSLENAPTTLSAERTALHQRVGAELLADLQQEIGGTGKVQSWQESVVGSKGGYAAVRAKAKTNYQSSDKGKSFAVGRVTNAIEYGHWQVNGRYVKDLGAKLVASKVAGRGFYADARKRTEATATEAAKEFIEILKQELEGTV